MLELLPIMPALCSMRFDAHYVQNYAGIIGASLRISSAQFLATHLVCHFICRVLQYSFSMSSTIKK